MVATLSPHYPRQERKVWINWEHLKIVPDFPARSVNIREPLQLCTLYVPGLEHNMRERKGEEKESERDYVTQE